MTVLHLFDLYLPNTMNWASGLIQYTPAVEQWIAAPWILNNAYRTPGNRHFIRPIQQKTKEIFNETDEQAWFLTNLIRLERRLPMYRTWLSRQLKKNPPDLIHAHFAPVGCHYWALAKRLSIPILTSFYGYDYARLPFERPSYRKQYQALFKNGAAFTTTGELSPKYLEALGCPKSKIVPIPLSIDPGSFPFVKRIKNSGQLRLVQVATITEKKGHLDALKALRQALRNCPNLHLTLVGEPQEQQLLGAIQHFVKSNQLEDKVDILDALPHRALPAFLGQFDLFIHPSRTATNLDCEGAPVAILEAMSTGLPVIATWHADIPKQVLHGQTGLLANERDVDGLAAHLERFYFMDALEYDTFSARASQHIAQHFNLYFTGPQLYQLYQSILSTA